MARYSFGPFSLDPEARVLLRDGEPIPVAGKTLDTLLVLVENRGRLVDKDELLSRIWPGTVVEEANLSQSIFTVRKILGDSPKDHRYVATIAGRGYQFVAPVAELQTPTPIPVAVGQEPPAVSKRKRQLLVGTTILITAGLFVLWVVLRRERPEPGEPKLQQLTTNSPEMSISGAAISPDGKYLAYGASNDLYLRLIATGETQLVTKPESLRSGDTWFPVAWLPGGTHVVASSFQQTPEGQVFTGWTIPVIGGSPTRLRDNAFVHSVSPDGSLIAFTAGRDRSLQSYKPDISFPNIDKEIWIMGPHGENARRISAADDRTFFGAVQWSPDGGRLAYVKVHLLEMGFPDVSIETRDLKGGPPSPILLNFRGPTFCWAPDGRILYASPEPLPNSQDTSLWELWADSKSGKPKTPPRKITTLRGFGIEQLGRTADGKKLVFVKGVYQTNAYVARLAPGSRVEALRRLTFDERPSVPWTWTRDSKSVIFTSNRTGAFAMYKQSVDRSLAELIPTGPESVRLARVSPNGAWIVYGTYSDSRDPGKSISIRLMRVPVTGGTPQPILETDAKNYNFDCPRLSTAPCVIEERHGNLKEAVFSTFDPLNGRRGEIFRIAVPAEAILQWTISPDGSRLALVNSDPQDREIKIVSLSGKIEQTLEVKGWPHPTSIDWTADSKALLLSFIEQSGATLARVDFSGNVQPLYTLGGSNFTFGVSSPDGRWLAICAQALSGRNVWLLENL